MVVSPSVIRSSIGIGLERPAKIGFSERGYEFGDAKLLRCIEKG